MGKNIIPKILTLVGKSALSAKDAVAAILSEGYGASVSRLERSAANRAAKREHDLAAMKHNLASVLYKLKKDGLILEKNKLLHLTARGDSKLATLADKEKFSAGKYKSEPAANFLIVAYDIPGKNYKKRLWLRESLSNIGLRAIQQSLWMGKIKLPKEFLEDLKNLNLFNCVEIFEITKSGTLREI